MKKNSKKGFTLAELLIVIAIIAILIAIMFPVFGAQIDKARAAADLANVRAKYSELVADSMLGTGTDLTQVEGTATISLKDLAGAMQYDKSTVTYTPGKAATETEAAVAPKITVKYGDYSGTFNIDTDVSVADVDGTVLETATTYDKTGNEPTT